MELFSSPLLLLISDMVFFVCPFVTFPSVTIGHVKQPTCGGKQRLSEHVSGLCVLSFYFVLTFPRLLHPPA